MLSADARCSPPATCRTARQVNLSITLVDRRQPAVVSHPATHSAGRWGGEAAAPTSAAEGVVLAERRSAAPKTALVIN